MSAKFCSQCGKQNPDGNSFCTFCGAAQSAAQLGSPQTFQSVQTTTQAYQQPNISGPQAYQQPSQAGSQSYQQHYQAAPPMGYGAPRATTAKATGLIVGVFALVAAFILAVVVFILPSKEDFSLLSLDDAPQSSALAYSQPGQESNAAGSASSVEYGVPPDSILNRVNVNAVAEDYYGSYSGRVSFRSENLEIMSELTGDGSYAEMLSKYNGKSFECTAEIDDSVCAFSPEVYSENEDGSFYTYYYYDIDLENGIAVDEESDFDEEMGLQYYVADKAYLLTDGSIYVIQIVSGALEDGRYLSSEIRFELSPNR